MKKLLLVLFFTIFPVLAHGTTYYVAKTGSDSNSCSSAQSPSTPKLTINAGISCLNGGDTLTIKAGTYNERINNGAIPSGSANSPTTIKSEVLRGAVLQPGSGRDFVIIGIDSQAYITFDGLVFDGNNVTSGYGILLYQNASNVVTLNCEFKNIAGNNNPSNSGGIFFGSNSGGFVVRGSSFHDIGNNDQSDQCSSCYSYGMYLPTHDALIENNEFYNISGYSIHGYSSGGGIDNNIIRNNYIHDTGTFLIGHTGGTNNQIYNNILVRVGTGVYPYERMGLRVDGNNSFIYNNTIVGSGAECIWLQGSNLTARNNICWQNRNDAITTGGSGNSISNNLLGQNPLFVNAATEDFHLQNGSPAIDAGVVMPGLSFNGSAPDLGALESGADGQFPAPTRLRLVGN